MGRTTKRIKITKLKEDTFCDPLARGPVIQKKAEANALQEFYTYRISKLPRSVSLESLRQGIHDDAAKAVTHISLAQCPYRPEASATATVTFRGKQRTEGLMKEAFEFAEIDNTFHGFTPLNKVDGAAKAMYDSSRSLSVWAV